MSRLWLRPYRPGRGRWWVILWEAGAFVYLDWATARLLQLAEFPALMLTAILLALWVLGAWRIQRIGLYVGDVGVMIRNIFTTRKIAWHNIESIQIEPVTHRFLSFVVPSGRCLFIRSSNGARINTSLREKGVDFHSQPEAFQAVYRDLRERLREARSTPAS